MPEAGILACFFVVAVLYSAVGHGGASGYLAVMSLLIGLNEKIAGPTALVLNLVVASIGTIQFASVRQIAWRELLPFVIGSIYFAYLGGSILPSEKTYQYLVGVVLLVAAGRLIIGLPKRESTKPTRDIIAIAVGAIIGFLSGLTRTGGGIFLTPLLLLMGWATPKQAAGISVAFILVNSAAGLTGRLSRGGIDQLPNEAIGWAIAAGLGGLLGSWFGARRSGFTTLRRLLAVVLLIAAVKLIWTA